MRGPRSAGLVRSPRSPPPIACVSVARRIRSVVVRFRRPSPPCTLRSRRCVVPVCAMAPSQTPALRTACARVHWFAGFDQ
eukprot:172166-Prymnesium_polylepis.1